MSVFKRLASQGLNGLYSLLFTLADEWYQNHQDALSVLQDISKKREKGYSDIDPKVRDACVASQHQDWKHLMEEDIKTKVDDLKAVYDMLIHMGYTEQQSQTLLGILCSRNDIPGEVREKLVSSYMQYVELQPFTQEGGAVLFQGGENYLKTELAEKNIDFRMCVQSCLPITFNTLSLESTLSTATHRVQEGKAKACLMLACGVTPDRSSVSNTAPHALTHSSLKETPIEEVTEKVTAPLLAPPSLAKSRERKKLVDPSQTS